MALVLANRVQETTNTTGTGTITLAGAVAGFQSFAAIGNANTTYYTITSGTAWEVGIGTYTASGTTLARTTILASSAAGAAISLTGTSVVFATYPAEKSVNYDASNNVGIGTTAPTAKLEVVGNAIINTGVLTLTPGYSIRWGGAASGIYSGTGTSDMTFTVGSAVRITVNGLSGNVGIGTDNPAGILDARASNATAINSYLLNTVAYGAGNTAASILNLGKVESGTVQVMGAVYAAPTADTSSTSGFLSLYTRTSNAATEKMRITTGGDVGIGLTAPSGKLHVLGDTSIFQGTGGSTLSVINGSGVRASSGLYLDTVVTTGGDIFFRPRTATAMTILATNGNVGIGTSAPATKLEVSATSAGATAEVLRLSNVGTGANAQAQIKFYAASTFYGSISGGYGAAAPQMTFNLPVSGNYVWQNSGTESMRLDSTGLFGVGAALAEDSAGVYSFSAGELRVKSALENGTSQISIYNNNTINDSEQFYVALNLSDIELGNRRSGALALRTNNTERMRITSAGLVGIGTTAPVNELEVYGSGSPRLAIRAPESITESIELGFQYGAAANASTNTLALIRAIPTQVDPNPLKADLAFNTNAGDSSTEAMRIDSSGNVGIGIATPGARLHLHSTAGGGDLPRMRFTNGGTGTTATDGMFVGISNTSQLDIWNFENDAVRFATNSTERMRITGAGLVGIGTNAPDRSLTIGNAGVLGINNSGNTLQSTLQHAAGGLDIYAGGASYVAFGTNSSERMRITSTGNVLVGTTTTVGKLTVASATGNAGFNFGTSASPERANLYYDTDGTGWKFNIGKVQSAAFTAQMTFQDNGNIGIGNSSPTAKLDIAAAGTLYARVQNTSGTGDAYFNAQNSLGSGFFGINTTGPYVYTAQAIPMLFYTTGLERMRIDASGNVGIGVVPSAWGASTPALQILRASLWAAANNSYQGANYYFDGTDRRYITTDVAAEYGQVSGEHRWYVAASGTAGAVIGFTETMRINTSGNVGIGATGPVSRLHVNNASTAATFITGGNNNGGIQVGVRSDGVSIVAAYAGTGIIFGNNNSTTLAEFARFDSSGNFGIGTASPGYKLDVNSSTNAVKVTSPAGSPQVTITDGNCTAFIGYTIGATTSALNYLGTQTNHAQGFITNNTERMRIDTSGNVGIGTSSPGSKLEILGGTVGTTAGNEILIANQRAVAGTNSVQLLSRLIRASAGTDWTTTTMRLQGRVDTSNFGYIDFVSGGGQGLVFGSDASERMRIDSSGNVGIGTSAPGKRLEVRGIGSNATIRLKEDGTYGVAWDIDVGSTNQMLFTNNAGSMLSYAFINGNVGIGVTSPTAKLDVLGDLVARTNASGGNTPVIAKNDSAASNVTKTTGIQFQGVDTVGTTKSIGYIQCGPADVNYVGSYLVFQTRSADATSEKMRLDDIGRLGIGTSSPGALLQLNKASGAADLRLSVAGTLYANIYASSSDVNVLSITAIPLIFGTDNTERFRILSTGGITSSALADAVGYKGLPQNSQTASYTLALTDMGKHISITTGGVVIPANASVAFPIGSAISIFNNSGSNQTISITTDTLRLAGTATTGSRTLAQYGVATCLKVTATVWVISGAGVT